MTGGNTTGRAGDYPAMCASVTQQTSPDVIYKIRPTTSTTLRAQVTNPAPGFASPVIAWYDGTAANYDPLTESESAGTTTNLGNTNEAPATAQSVTIGAAPATFNGNTSAMRSLYYGGGTNDQWDEAAISGGQQCGADIASGDAYFTFTVDGNTDVRIDAAGTAIGHTVSLYDSTPIQRPDDTVIATATNVDDRSGAFNGGVIGAIDGTWAVRSIDSNLLTVSGLENTTEAPGGDGTTALLIDGSDNDGLIDGENITITAGTTTGYTADYPALDDTSLGSPVCGSSDSGRDALYRLRAGSARDVRITMNPAFNGNVALLDGLNGDPLTNSEYSPGSTITLPTSTVPTLPAGCSSGSFYFGGSWYALCEGTSVTWAQADTDCRSTGGELVQIDSQVEGNFLVTQFPGKSGWIGANDQNAEGAWRWTRDERSDRRRSAVLVGQLRRQRLRQHVQQLGHGRAERRRRQRGLRAGHGGRRLERPRLHDHLAEDLRVEPLERGARERATPSRPARPLRTSATRAAAT